MNPVCAQVSIYSTTNVYNLKSESLNIIFNIIYNLSYCGMAKLTAIVSLLTKLNLIFFIPIRYSWLPIASVYYKRIGCKTIIVNIYSILSCVYKIVCPLPLKAIQCVRMIKTFLHVVKCTVQVTSFFSMVCSENRDFAQIIQITLTVLHTTPFIPLII